MQIMSEVKEQSKIEDKSTFSANHKYVLKKIYNQRIQGGVHIGW
jgi:hypothetical protein